MSKQGLLAKQLLFIGLYTLFFAVQLHYKYIYVYCALTSQVHVNADSRNDVIPGASISVSLGHDTPGNLNVMLNKRYVPSEFIGVATFDFTGRRLSPTSKPLPVYHSISLLPHCGWDLADRGPPATTIPV